MEDLIKLTEENIIKEFLSLPGIRDTQSSVKGKLNIAKYYCTVFKYDLHSIRNKRGVNPNGQTWIAFNDFEHIFLESLSCDPVSFRNNFNSKYKWPDRNKIKVTETKESFDELLYEKIHTVLLEQQQHIIELGDL